MTAMKTSRSHYSTIKVLSNKNMLLQVVKALEKREFTASYCPSINVLNRILLKKIPKSAVVGVPGSVTIREVGIIERLKARGNRIVQHWKRRTTHKTDREVRQEESRADYYLTSANAITIEGDIINIDGIGNRVAAMIYGPQNVFIIAGSNKIVRSIDDGIRRSKDIAAVMNAQRVDARTPCVKTGICVDCNAKQRICRVISIMQYRPWQTNIEIFLVNQHLGF